MPLPCPFCSYASGWFTRKLIIYEDENTLVFPSRHQKRCNYGHCLVVPREHVVNIYDFSSSLAIPLFESISTASRVVKSALSAEGVSIRQNNDPAGGQDVFHLHFHIIPRFAGDNFESSPYELVDEQARIEQAEELRSVWD